MITWGPDWEREICASPYRLRFELGCGSSCLSRFTTSFDRARAIARSALKGSRLFGVIAAYPHPEADINAEAHGWSSDTGFRHLAEMGVPSENADAQWQGYFWPGDQDDEEVEQWRHRALTITWEQADILLWNQVAYDTGISPQAPVLSKLVDEESGVSVFAYDDRGMDVTALSKDRLLALYVELNEWLLDYDRNRMDAAFQR